MRTTKPRLAPLPEDEWSEETKQVLAPLRAMGGGRVLNIFSTLAHHPQLLRRWLGFGSHVLAQSTLSPRWRELVILRIGWLCRAEYEWAQHVVIGRQVGLTAEDIAALKHGPEHAHWSAIEGALLRATDELHHESCISDATWQQLNAELSTQQVLDLIFAVGQYTLVSMALNSLGVQLDPGLSGFGE